MKQHQLTLDLRLPEPRTFDNFVVGGNAEIVHHLKSLLDQPGFIYLWGEPGLGCTHLLQAACHYADQKSQPSLYFSLQQFQHCATEMFDGLEQLSLVCIDEISSIIGISALEEAMFHCFNRLQANGVSLVVGGACAPTALGLTLPDLRSRLASGLTFQIKPLSDDQKIVALQQHADQQGIQLPESVANFLLNHCSRDFKSLYDILERLSSASLSFHRKVSIHFVKQVLGL